MKLEERPLKEFPEDPCVCPSLIHNTGVSPVGMVE